MKILFSFLDVILFTILIFVKSFFFGKQIQPNFLAFKSLLPSVFACIAITVGISLLLKHKRRMRFLYICNIIFTCFMVGDLVYFRYFKDMISVFTLRNMFQLGAVTASVENLFKLSDLFFFLDIILLKNLKKLYKNKSVFQLNTKFNTLSLCILIAFGVGTNGYCMNKLSKEQPKLLSSMYNKVYIVKTLGDINYHSIDAYNFITNSISRSIPLSQKDKANINTFLHNNNKPISNNYSGLYKGKNLIIIQVEALQNFAINATYEGQEITPNLNAFVKRSCYFNNYFYQVASGGTSDAEFMTNNSLYPASSGAAYFLYARNQYSSLGNKLKENGYATAALHGYKESFWNRQNMYETLGFQHFYGEKSYNTDEKIGLGISDKSFLSQSVIKIQKLSQPFYSFIITLSSHYPYDNIEKYGNFNSGKFENTLLGNYMKAIHYTDEQLGVFLKDLESNGLMQNSIIAIYGDHNAITKISEDKLMEFMNLEDTDINWSLLQKVPLILHVPDEKIKGTNELYSGEMDLYPTLCNLMSIQNSNMLGKDLFNSSHGRVIFRNGSFTDGNVYYMSQTDKYYDINTKKVLEKNKQLTDIKNDYISQLQYSDEILKHNLLKK